MRAKPARWFQPSGSFRTITEKPAKTISVITSCMVLSSAADQTAFGRKEFWTANARTGDCEDFALAKRSRLLRKGFKPSQLLLTMGYNGREAHTVLVVRTRDGDYVLDNLHDDVQPVQSARMSFQKIQAPDHGGKWLKVTGKTGKRP